MTPGARVSSPAPIGALSPNSDRLLTADDLARRWSVPKAAVYRLAREQKIPTISIGRYRRFSLAAIETFEAEGGVAADA